MAARRVSRPRAPWAIAVAAAGAALALWIVPMPRDTVTRVYSEGIYPPWQRTATLVANLVPIAVFDLIVAAAAVFIVWSVVRLWRAQTRRPAAARLLLAAGLAGLWFHAAWGLNYRRTPIAVTLGLDASRLPADALEQFGLEAARQTAALADRLDRETPVTGARLLAELAPGFERATQLAGSHDRFRPGRPKRSLFDLYFRWAAIDGLTNPFLPETIVVSGLTPAEAYGTAAHEWAHLAGYASEDEANFVGWLACLEAGGGARYNGWLFALTKAMRVADQAQRRRWLDMAGPLAARDLAAIRARYERSSPAVRQAASAAYDQFLRANRVEGGIDSYDLVLRLMLAAQAHPRFEGLQARILLSR